MTGLIRFDRSEWLSSTFRKLTLPIKVYSVNYDDRFYHSLVRPPLLGQCWTLSGFSDDYRTQL